MAVIAGHFSQKMAKMSGKNSIEVDYVSQMGARIVPMEVKANKGNLTSLKIFSAGIHISKSPLQKADKILTLPFYLIAFTKNLI